MDFALERQFLDPYQSGGDDVDSMKGWRGEEVNIGVKDFPSYLCVGEAATILMTFINVLILLS